jgi:hypothetical protein
MHYGRGHRHNGGPSQVAAAALMVRVRFLVLGASSCRQRESCQRALQPELDRELVSVAQGKLRCALEQLRSIDPTITVRSGERFVDDGVPWAHLDVAGTAMGSPSSEVNASWASGFGVRLLDQLVRERYERPGRGRG